jgi:omega-hydroxy-beta-dihydromenaquinone-9 sulfotransferase
MKLMARNRFSLFPRYVLRFLLVFQNSFWSSFFARRDKLFWGDYYLQYPLGNNPVIIIGHWRTGSTYLHQLMNLDEQLVAPTLFQTSIPDGFLTARRYYAPIMKKFLGKFRPFDQMKTGIDEPQEDEFATYRMSTFSPLEQLMFPKSQEYFLLGKDCRFIPEGNKKEKWEKSIILFYRKIAWFSKKRLVLKNPFHSMRMEFLRSKFPEAKFIHIYRNPCNVVPSTIKMWTIVGSQNAMNNKWRQPTVEEVAKFQSIMLKEIRNQLGKLPRGSYSEVCYENLEKDPVHTLRKAYIEIGLEFTNEFETYLNEFLTENRNYEKNIYTITEEDKEIITRNLEESMKYYGYL